MKSLLALTHSLFLALLLAAPVRAQVGNNNPSGVAGIFNGDAGGRPVDPYTGNATNSITDINVAGAVGEYPLALVRTSNSRSIVSNTPFALPGGWNHSYNWILEDSPTSSTSNFHPTRFVVDFPDGRIEAFRAVNWDTANYYRVRPGTDAVQSTSGGVRGRFVPLNLSTMLAKLILPDGGQVEFSATQHSYQQNGTHYYYKYKATAVIDPYGLRTSFAYDGQGRLSTVSQPAATNRSLQFYYRPNNSLIIDHVTEVINGANRRTVQYNYTLISPGGQNYVALTSVTYYGQSQWNASYKYRAPNVAPTNGVPLLWTCDEPMYAGPMKRIAYTHQTTNNADGSAPSYGQVSLEKYWDGIANHESAGVTVFTLTVGEAPNVTNKRKETRGDGAERNFIYNAAGYLTWASDFMNRYASQGYDTKKYINVVTDRNVHATNYTLEPLTGNVTQVQYPATPGDTMPQSNQGSTVSYKYGWNGCADTNNRDASNPYFICSATDEAGHVTQFTRDTNHRVTRIDYPDGGYETFTYNGFGQVLYHRLTTGGTESFTYDARGLKQTYRDAANSGYNPSLRYQYDTYDRVTDITDAFGGSLGDPAHATSFTYNLRGQVLVTTLPKDVNNGNTRHTITNVYNSDGTLQTKTDELGNITNYTYDDYRRATSVTPPARGDGTGTHTTSYLYYDPWAQRTNYADTNAQPSFVTLPSTKTTWIVYDDDWRKMFTTVGWYSGEDATTVYEYDAVGNMTKMTAPNQQPGQQYAGKSTQTTYDERNRPFQITDALSNTTSIFYDTAGREKQIIRPNSQWITYDSFDNMNRVLQQTVVANWPSSMQATKYTYYQSGLLHTMQDPHLVELNNGYQYTYEYDTMGRKKKLTYPPDSASVQRTEQSTYDAMGRLQTFINRDGKTQTFNYDGLNRVTYFTWANNAAPRVDFGYDAASRLTTINNVNANITRAYYNDNLLWTETEAITGGTSKVMGYGYDEDGNRAHTVYPDGTTFDYTYTGRNQLHEIQNNNSTVVGYSYNLNGDMTNRSFRVGADSTYAYDSLDRVTNITHSFTRDTRTLDYDYDSVGNREWTKRDGGNGDVFSYDLAGQVIGVKLNIAHPDTTPAPPATIVYDANGNRTSFAAYGPNDSYTVNNLNQYATRNGANAVYDNNGNLTTSVDGSTYSYDAQNRLISATMETFVYDGLNRQVSRAVNNGTPTYSVWDGWDLLQEYHMSGNNVIVDASYLYGPSGLVKNLTSSNCYFQDGSGSTSHLSSSAGELKEWYRYDLQGTPTIYDADNNQRSASAFNVRHLFTGQQWYGEIGLYDLRNRFYSPDIGRFLQPDPGGFNGDATNLYRYCGNNPVTYGDPTGEYAVYKASGGYWYYIANPGYQSLVGTSIGPHGWCAEGAQMLAGGYYNVGGAYYDMPNTAYWRQGTSLSSATAPGTVVARGWVNGGYPQISPAAYVKAYGSPLYHTGIFVASFNGEAFILEQYVDKNGVRQPLQMNAYPLKQLQQEGWSEVTVPGSDDRYASGTSTDPNARGGSDAPGLTEDQQAQITGLLRLASMFNPYWGYLPTTNTTNFAGGIAGLKYSSGSPWDLRNQMGGLDPFAAFGHIYEGNPIGAMEPGECFVAGTPVLMANGSEKPIESIQVGEAVLAWNEETKTIFSTTVAKALHHEERPQTLFDIELEDGRHFTVNNDHPMYVVEDGDFVFTDDLAARFAKGKPITFQDNKNQIIKVASLRMRRETCKMYNLNVEGQGKNGHTYYANGILVHNSGAGYRHK